MENSNTDKLIKALYVAGGAYCAMELVKVISSWSMNYFQSQPKSNLFFIINKRMKILK